MKMLNKVLVAAVLLTPACTPQAQKYGADFAACVGENAPAADIVKATQEALKQGPTWREELKASAGDLALNTVICAVKAAITMWRANPGRLDTDTVAAIQRGEAFLTEHNVK